MNHPSSDSSPQRQRPFSGGLALQLLGGLKNLSLLLVGVSLGAIGTNWLSPKSSFTTSVSADELLASPQAVENRDVLNPSSNQDAVALATVCVKTRMGQGEEACASGVSLDPQLVGIDRTKGAVVLTNYHVIANMGSRPPLQLAGKGEVYNAEIIKQSPEFDLVLLLVSQAEFPIAPLAETSPEQGTAVRAMGFPNNQPLTIKDSSLLGKTQECLAVAPCLALQQGTITFGNSGGPLEANGKVVGITQGEIVDEIAIPVEQIRQFLAGEVPPASRSQQFEPGFPPMREPPPYHPHRRMETPPPPYSVW